MHPAVIRRITTLGISAAATALAVGTALPAIAAPPPGHGNGNPPSTPPGQAKQTTAPAPAPTHTPPGRAKGHTHAHSHGHGHGTTHAGGNGNGNGNTGPAHNPPGNNGTVKIHSLAGDAGHHNVAHPGCAFAVDFWGFDQDQTLTVSFAGQAPTGKGVPLTFDAPDGTSVTSPDPAGGGNDPDGELVFTPTAAQLSVLGPPAHEGYHVRLTVDTGQGGGHKYKVFWISPCTSSAPTTTSGTTTDTATGTPTGTATDTPTLSTDTPTVRSLHVSAARGGAMTAAGPAAQLESRRLNQASPPVSSLPFTGANVSTLITAGGLALLAGMFLRAAVRRRRKIG